MIHPRPTTTGTRAIVLPTLSVVVPARDAEAIVEACLQSVVRQGPAAVILVDGRSTDGTVEIARRYADVIVSDEGRGLPADRSQPVLVRAGGDDLRPRGPAPARLRRVLRVGRGHRAALAPCPVRRQGRRLAPGDRAASLRRHVRLRSWPVPCRRARPGADGAQAWLARGPAAAPAGRRRRPRHPALAGAPAAALDPVLLRVQRPQLHGHAGRARPAPAGLSPMALLARLRGRVHLDASADRTARAVLVSSVSLVAGKVAVMGFGFLSWVVAARLYPVAEFGLAAGAVAAVTLCAQLALLGVGSAIITLLPVHDGRPGRLLY